MLLGGRTAEEELTGEVCTGAANDITRATSLARRMVAAWGMDPDVGPVDLTQSEAHPFLGKEIAQPRRFSDPTAHEVDRGVARLIAQARATARGLLRAHADVLKRLVAELEERETLERDDLLKIFGVPPAVVADGHPPDAAEPDDAAAGAGAAAADAPEEGADPEPAGAAAPRDERA